MKLLQTICVYFRNYGDLPKCKANAKVRVGSATFLKVIVTATTTATATSHKKVIATAIATSSQKSNRYHYCYL